MEKVTIIAALNTRLPELARVEEQDLEFIQENAYRLHTHPPYFIKYIADDDRLGKNELWINQTVLTRSAIPSPALIFSLKVEEGTIAAWEWVDGVDLREYQRSLLPQAFELVGDFHKDQRHAGRVYSLVNHCSFDTVKELLAAEVSFLTAHFAESVRQGTRAAFARLEAGFATFVHGDLHPGNIRATGKGLQFVDWGYCVPSLSLFDLGYVQTVVFDDSETDRPWWVITPEEAQLVLPAYFSACGMDGSDYYSVQRAVMLWSELWGYHNCIKNSNEDEAGKCKHHIDRLIAMG